MTEVQNWKISRLALICSCPCRWVLPTLLLLFIFVSLAPAQTPFTVVWKDRRLSILAKKAPLSEVLKEVVHRTGLQVRGLERLQTQTSVRFSGLSLQEGLQQLLAPVNYMIISEKSTPGGEGLPRLVLIVGGQTTPSREVPSPEEAAQPKTTLLDTDLQSPDPSIRLARLQELVRTNAADIDRVLYAATQDQDPSIRQLAYEILYARGEQALVSDLLRQGAQSANSDTRKTAIEALGTLFASDAVALLGEATEDEDIDVRYTAFQQLSHLEAEAGLELLRERLTHPDPAIRIMAIEAMASKGEAFAREAALATLYDNDEVVRGKAEGLMYELEAGKERQR